VAGVFVSPLTPATKHFTKKGDDSKKYVIIDIGGKNMFNEDVSYGVMSGEKFEKYVEVLYNVGNAGNAIAVDLCRLAIAARYVDVCVDEKWLNVSEAWKWVYENEPKSLAYTLGCFDEVNKFGGYADDEFYDAVDDLINKGVYYEHIIMNREKELKKTMMLVG
jgi:hypothetical protein